MSNYKLGKRSIGHINNCILDIGVVVREAILDTDVDFTVIDSIRTREECLVNFLNKSSRIDPRKYTDEQLLLKSYHFVTEEQPLARAVDFIAYHKDYDITYDRDHIMYLSGVFTSIGNRLLREGVIRHKIISGTNWDGDGVVVKDQTFFDGLHIQAVKV